VWPAAGFAEEARRRCGADLVECNLAATEISRVFDRRIEGPASVAVPLLVAELLRSVSA
jgi:NAD-dependent SIR2 family protein deacetylase